MNFPVKILLTVAIAVPLLAAKTYYEERDIAPIVKDSGVHAHNDSVVAGQPTKQSSPSVFTPPQEAELPDNAFGELVRRRAGYFYQYPEKCP